jgi:drug/metabolite transporter (DMT)-like permease
MGEGVVFLPIARKMAPQKGEQMKAIGLALSMPFIATLGQLLLKFGLRQVEATGFHGVKGLGIFIVSVFSTPLILAAIPVYVIGLVVWLVVLAELDLSYAYPLVALTYVLVPLVSYMILGEHIPPLRWIGVGVVFAGVVLVGLTI